MLFISCFSEFHKTMIIYISMIAVILLCAMGNAVLTQTAAGTIRIQHRKLLVYIPMLYIIFWTGIRTQFVDTAAYIQTYMDMPSESLRSIFSYIQSFEKDKLFYFLSAIFKYIFGDNYHLWLFAISLLCGLCIVRQVYRHSDSPYFSLYLFMTMSIFTWMMNGIRQFIAITVLFALSDWLVDQKKRWLYVLAVVVLSFVHSSALYALPFIVIVMFSKPWDWKMILLSVAVAIAVANADRFTEILTETVAQDYAATFDESAGSNVIRTFVAYVPVAISFWGRKIIRRKDDPYLNLCVNMSLVCALLYTLSSVTNGILVGRMPIYFQIYNLLLLPWLIKHCFNAKERQILTILCVGCYMVFFLYQATIAGSYYYASELTGFLGKSIW